MSIIMNVLPSGRRALTRRTLVTATAGTALVAVVGGVAYAAWNVSTAPGGTSEAQAATAVQLTVTAGTSVGDIYPSASATGSVYLKLTNPNSFPVTLTAATFGSPTTAAAGCPGSNVTVANQTGLSISVPANTTTAAPYTISSIVTMATTAPNACQGVVFTIPVTLTGTSS
jgi:hypothetical protein